MCNCFQDQLCQDLCLLRPWCGCCQQLLWWLIGYVSSCGTTRMDTCNLLGNGSIPSFLCYFKTESRDVLIRKWWYVSKRKYMYINCTTLKVDSTFKQNVFQQEHMCLQHTLWKFQQDARYRIMFTRWHKVSIIEWSVEKRLTFYYGA